MRVHTYTLIVACSLGMESIPAAAVPATETPIEHLIVVVGENISFDCLFATYEAPPGSKVANLLSRHIVDKEGQPGRAKKVGAASSPTFSIL